MDHNAQASFFKFRNQDDGRWNRPAYDWDGVLADPVLKIIDRKSWEGYLLRQGEIDIRRDAVKEALRECVKESQRGLLRWKMFRCRERSGEEVHEIHSKTVDILRQISGNRKEEDEYVERQKKAGKAQEESKKTEERTK